MGTQADTVLFMIQQTGVLRAKDARSRGIPAAVLGRLVAQGLIVRVGRGLYVAADGGPLTENHSLVEAAKRVPHAVVCLLSALRFHGLGTQSPFEVWIAIDRKAARPRADAPALRVVRFSGQALSAGVERHIVEGVEVAIYSAAKTVADCFKYRNKIGLDVALEALNDYLRRRDRNLDDLWRYAKVCRVERVMRPYMEAMT